MLAVNRLLLDNRRLLGKLVVVVALMFGFGYALVPCTAPSAKRWA